MRPILFPLGPGLTSVNHRLPSGPLVMSFGLLPAVGIGNSLKVAAEARSAPPPAAHNKAIVASSKRRYLFCMCSPQAPSTKRLKTPLSNTIFHNGAEYQNLASTGARA